MEGEGAILSALERERKVERQTTTALIVRLSLGGKGL